MMIPLGPWKVEVQLTSKSDLNGDYGDWDLETKTVRVQDGLSALEMSMTLIHEMLHAMSDLYHLRLSEQSVRALENSITQLIQTSPDLAECLVEAIKPQGPRTYDANTWSALAGSGSWRGDDARPESGGVAPEAIDGSGVEDGGTGG